MNKSLSWQRMNCKQSKYLYSIAWLTKAIYNICSCFPNFWTVATEKWPKKRALERNLLIAK